MVIKKQTNFFLFLLSALSIASPLCGMVKEKSASDDFPDEITQKIIIEMRFAQRGAVALKNIFSLYRVSQNYQRLIEDKQISRYLIHYVLSHYCDIDQDIVESLCSFTNKDEAKLFNIYWKNASNAWNYLYHAAVSGEKASLNEVSKLLTSQIQEKDLQKELPKIITCYKNNKKGSVLLTIAVEEYRHLKDREIVDFLINNGADIKATSIDGNTCLVLAVELCDTALAQFLLDRGIDINATSNGGNTCLAYAARTMGNEDMMQFLLDKGLSITDTNKYGQNCLFYAVQTIGNQAMLQFLLDKGADINATDNDGNTCLGYAATIIGNEDMMQFLINKGLSITDTNKYGQNCLFYAVQTIGNQAMLQFLLDNGADINATDNEGETCLFNAVLRMGNEAMLQFLLDNGADTTIKNREGYNYLSFAARHKGRIDYAKYIGGKAVEYVSPAIAGALFIRSAVHLTMETYPITPFLLDFICNGCRPWGSPMLLYDPVSGISVACLEVMAGSFFTMLAVKGIDKTGSWIRNGLGL